MNSIVRSRGTGKTKDLIQLAYDNQGVIVCKNPLSILEKIHAYGYSNIQVISYQDYLETTYEESKQNKYYIRNVDQFLELLNVEGFTLTV